MKPGWKCKRGGLHEMTVDSANVVARVEQGSETRLWYWTAWICGEAAGGPPCETMSEAQTAAESALSEA